MKRFHSLLKNICVFAVIVSMAILSGCAVLPGGQKPGPAKPEAPKPQATTVALLVPRTGAVKVVSSLIDGAKLGASSQAATRNPAQIRVIYTDGTWLEQVGQLPENTIIGGLLSDGTYAQLKAAGILDKRVFFAFRSKLPAGDEGTRAWRFFHSMDDQVTACANFVADSLGVNSVASFGPSDAYSNAYLALLDKNLAAKGITLQRIAAQGDSAQWGELLKPVINPQTNEATGTLLPQTPFKAVFLTDTWRRLTAVHTAFASNGEDRLYMIGTTLWDDANVRGNQEAARYALVAWPSAFLRNSAPASLANTSFGNFWGALGYDFARFAARLAISGRPSSQEVTDAARTTSSMTFAMAPVSYNRQGVASQKLFMVQAGAGGSVLADPAAMKDAREAAVQAVEMRGLPQDPSLDATPAEAGQPQDGALTPAQAAAGTGQQAAPAVQPRSTEPIMRSAPNSSYRLSLPGAAR